MTSTYPGLTTWSSAEYAAGFHARFEDRPTSESKSHSWQCGWEDAHLELLARDRHQKQTLAEADDYGENWGLLFDAGGDARVNGILFDERRTRPWKEGWIDADINLGAPTSRL